MVSENCEKYADAFQGKGSMMRENFEHVPIKTADFVLVF